MTDATSSRDAHSLSQISADNQRYTSTTVIFPWGQNKGRLRERERERERMGSDGDKQRGRKEVQEKEEHEEAAAEEEHVTYGHLVAPTFPPAPRRCLSSETSALRSQSAAASSGRWQTLPPAGPSTAAMGPLARRSIAAQVAAPGVVVPCGWPAAEERWPWMFL